MSQLAKLDIKLYPYINPPSVRKTKRLTMMMINDVRRCIALCSIMLAYPCRFGLG